MTLKMTTAQVVETSVIVTNSSFQNYTHPDDHTTRTTDTPGFKPFTIHTCIAEILKIKSNKIRKGWLFGSSKNHFSGSMVGFKLPIIKF